MTQTVAEILNGAADYLEEYGWTPAVMFGWSGNADYPCACAVGALFASEHPGRPKRPAEVFYAAESSKAIPNFATHLRNSGREAVDDDVQQIIDWNDGTEGGATVIAGLRAAALNAQAAGA